MTERPTPPPEGKLIADALKRLHMSQREAAKRSGISESRWRQIVSGYQKIGDTYVPVRGPADTVARMASVVRLAPHLLSEAKRPDVAAEMAHAHDQIDGSEIPSGADPHLRRLLELWPQSAEWQRRAIVGVFEEMLGAVARSPEPQQPEESRRTG